LEAFIRDSPVIDHLHNVLKRSEQVVAEIDGKVKAMIEKYKAGELAGVRRAYITAKMRDGSRPRP
jgi:hypothetical protein